MGICKNAVLEAMKNNGPREVEVKYEDFSIRCRVDLGLSARLALIEQTMKNIADVSDVNMGRSPLFRRAILEGLYLWNHTDAPEVLGLGEDIGQNELARLCDALDLAEAVMCEDEAFERMYDGILESLDYRVEFEDRLLAANLANTKINGLLDDVNNVARIKEVMAAFEVLKAQESG